MSSLTSRWATWFLPPSVSLAAGAGVTLALSDAAVMLLVAALLTALQVLSLRVAFRRVPLGTIVIVCLNAVGVMGYVLYDDIADRADVSTVLHPGASAYRSALLIFMLASLAFWAGILAARKAPKQSSHHGEARIVYRFPYGVVWIAGVAPLFLGIIGLSVPGIMTRPHYLDSYGPLAFTKAASVLLPVGLGATALLLFGPQLRSRWPAVALLGFYTLFLFAKGSRAIALVPLITYVVYLLVREIRPRTRRREVALAGASILFSLLCLNVVLGVRQGPAGLIPFGSRLVADPEVLLPDQPLAAVGNILFSVPLTGEIADNAAVVPRSYFATAVSPLPGSLTDWTVIQPQLSLNPVTPFNTLGELALYGWPFLIVYFLIAGFVFTRLEITARQATAWHTEVTSVVLAGLIALFAVSILQYNLRSTTRVLWYAAAVVFLLRAGGRMRHSAGKISSTAYRHG